jgi:hypothetical protein
MNLIWNKKIYVILYMKRILLICGYFTYEDDFKTDIYIQIKQLFRHTKYKLDCFAYKSSENIIDVYARLCEQISKGKYHSLMGHSMGGNLLSKYVKEHDTRRYDNVVLLMPYLQDAKAFLYKIPFLTYFYLPKFIVMPNSVLFQEGNVLNDNARNVSLKQSSQLDFMSDDETVAFFDKYKHVRLIYAKDEQVAVMNVVDQIKNKRIVDGLHECFHGVDGKSDFFDELDKLFFSN